MSILRKSSGNRWKRYNTWRSLNRAIDQARRLERQAEKRATYIEAYTVPKVPVPRTPKAFARLRIYFADGSSAGFCIRESAHGRTISNTLAGRKLAELLKSK